MITSEGKKLEQVIKKAIEDHEITAAEYEMIQHLVSRDGHTDQHEQTLLKILHEMIADKTIKRVP